MSHRTHPLVSEYKHMCSDLLGNGVDVQIMWISSHVGLEDNALVNKRAWHVALKGAVFDRAFPPVHFQRVARSIILPRTLDLGKYYLGP
jgi:hypothetical protein